MNMSQVVVVSGGGAGIGFATARHFARRGAQVAIVGRRADVLAHAAEQIGNAFPDAPGVAPLVADLAVRRGHGVLRRGAVRSAAQGQGGGIAERPRGHAGRYREHDRLACVARRAACHGPGDPG
ncbi:SDR family NAD(P)-dependent oxidoreductase [Burkholderia ubonensis]